MRCVGLHCICKALHCITLKARNTCRKFVFVLVDNNLTIRRYTNLTSLLNFLWTIQFSAYDLWLTTTYIRLYIIYQNFFPVILSLVISLYNLTFTVKMRLFRVKVNPIFIDYGDKFHAIWCLDYYGGYKDKLQWYTKMGNIFTSLIVRWTCYVCV